MINEGLGLIAAHFSPYSVLMPEGISVILFSIMLNAWEEWCYLNKRYRIIDILHLPEATWGGRKHWNEATMTLKDIFSASSRHFSTLHITHPNRPSRKEEMSQSISICLPVKSKSPEAFPFTVICYRAEDVRPCIFKPLTELTEPSLCLSEAQALSSGSLIRRLDVRR